jgi:hypothetical protein
MNNVVYPNLLNFEETFPNIELHDYENVPTGVAFNCLNELTQFINTNDDIIIHFINGDSGFGSQLTIFMQCLYYFYEKYPNIICLPSFSKNTTSFKYHDCRFNNSFFFYFNKIHGIKDLFKYKHYFLNMHVVQNYPFFNGNIPTMNYEPNRKYIEHFNNNYKFIQNNKVSECIDNLKRHKMHCLLGNNDNNSILPIQKHSIIGIHIRSIYQKKCHQPNYLLISIKERLLKIKDELDNSDVCNNYSIYIMTDVSTYIDLAKTVFSDVYYFENITRIDEERDIIGCLSFNQCGYKLGSDILNECFGLSLCDKIYVSNSNILFIVSLMNPNIVMKEY